MTQSGPQETSEWILVDPLTKEIINKYAMLDDNGREILAGGQTAYKVNDHWFMLNLKFVWRDAPKPPESATQGTMMRSSYRR